MSLDAAKTKQQQRHWLLLIVIAEVAGISFSNSDSAPVKKFMSPDQRNRGKSKNSKILSWRHELSQLSYNIRQKRGAENVVPDAFSRVCVSTSNTTLTDLHQSLRHPGFARLYHFVRQRNLPFSAKGLKMFVASAKCVLR